MSVAMAATEPRASAGLTNSAACAATYRNARSALSVSATPGFCTLTTTRAPDDASTAAWTWAMEAEASGVSSIDAKCLERGAPSSASITRLITGHGTGSVLSSSASNSAT